MAVDLARLGIEVDSRSALKANQRLQRLAVTGGTAEKRMVSLATSSRAMNGRLAISAQRFEQLGATAQRIGKTLSLALTAPLLGVGVASAKVASDFEAEMTKINTLVGLSSETVSGLQDEVLELSTEVGRGANELSRALFTVTSAGARGAEAMEILEQASKASAIGLGDTQEIARATTAVMQAYGEENMSAARATEILTSTVREGNLEASDLAPVLGRVIGLAKQLGVSFEEVGANVATFTRLGVGAEEAVTGLRGVMNALIKPTSQGAKVLQEAGLSFEQVRKSVQENGLAETMVGLLETFEGNDEALSEIIPNVRALSNVLGTAGAQGEAYEQILQNIGKSHGIVKEGFETVGETAQQQWNEAKAALEKAAIELGESTVPMMQELVEIVKDVSEWFSSLDDDTQRLIARFGVIAATVGPVVFLFGKLVSVLPTLISMMGTLTGIMAANPWVAAAGAIGAVATILAGKYLTATNDATEATNDFEKAMAGSTKTVKEAAKALDDLTVKEMFASTNKSIRITEERLESMKNKLMKDFEQVKASQENAFGPNTSFMEWQEALSDMYGKTDFLKLKEQLDSLKDQKRLIREMNKLEVGRKNVLNTVGGEMDRLSGFQKEQIENTERQIDNIRTELGLSKKYAEQVEKAQEETEQTAGNVDSIVKDWDKFLNSTEDAKRVTEPIKLIDEIMLGFPVSINEAEAALQKLQARFNSAVTPEARERLKGYIDDLQELIDKMKGVENATESAGNTNEQTTEKIRNVWDRVSKAYDDAKSALGEMDSITRELEFSFKSAFEEAVIGGESLRNVMQGLWEDIQKIILRKTVTTPLANFLSSFMGSFLGSGEQQSQNAHGGIFSSLTEVSGGGRRQQFGEAGPEAVFPVTRMPNGDYGVQAKGGGGGSMEVNIINYSGEDVETERRQTANGGEKLDVMIGKAVADDIRRGGQVYRAIRDTTDARRTTRKT